MTSPAGITIEGADVLGSQRAHAEPEDAGGAQVRAVLAPSACFERSVAVVFGVDDYADGIPSLRSAVKDAIAVAGALRDDHGFSIDEPYCNARATRTTLRSVLAALRTTLGPRDRLMFYFAGHAVALDADDGPAGHVLLSDAVRDDHSTFMPMRELHIALATLPCSHCLVVLDCCFAGAFRWASVRDVVGDPPRLYAERYRRFVDSPAWQLLVSAASDQPALDLLPRHRGETGDGHSPFAAALLAGLQGGADLTHDGIVTASELGVYLRQTVELRVEGGGRRQTPQLFALNKHERGEFVFQVPGSALALPPAPELTEDANPYRGLASFDEGDRGGARRRRFFGRERATREITAAVVAQPLTVVVAPSGAGKSSLVKAGLLPALRAKGWRILTPRRPGRSPAAVLQEFATELAGDEATTSLVQAVAAAAPTPTLIVIDQLEELVTIRTAGAGRRQPSSGDASREILQALAAALSHAPWLHLVVTVRSDVEPQFQDGPLAKWWSHGRYRVAAMTRAELRSVIEGPATELAMYFEPASLVDRLIDDVVGLPAPLPLLSFTLQELYRCYWNRRATDRALLESDYLAMGTVTRALTRRASEVFEELAGDSAYRVTVPNVMMRMVAQVGGELARRRMPTSELVFTDPAETARATAVLERFDAARLVQHGTEPAPDGKGTIPYAEPTHDELVRGWAQMRAWLDERRADHELLRALASIADTWDTKGRTAGYLWTSDPRLSQASALADQRKPPFNAREREFVAASRARRRFVQRRNIALIVAAMTLISVGGLIALWQQGVAADERDLAEQRLAASYHDRGRELVIQGTPIAALAPLVAARERGDDSAPLRVLFARAARNLGTVVATHPHSGIEIVVAVSADGSHIATGGGDGRVQILDSETLRPAAPALEQAGAIAALAFSADGTRLATASKSGTAQLWDVKTGAALGPAFDEPGIIRIDLAADGTRLLTASPTAATVWNIAARKREHALPHAQLATATFSRDGLHALTAGADRVMVWSVATGAMEVVLEGPSVAEFSPDGQRIVVGATSGVAAVYSIRGDELTPAMKHQGTIMKAAFSPDGTRIVTASLDRTARVWDAATGEAVTPPLRHNGWVMAAAFTPDGQHLVTGGMDRTARVWDADNGQPIFLGFTHDDIVTNALFTADGARLLTASGDRIWEWNAETRQSIELQVFRDKQRRGSAIAFSPDGARVAIGSWEGGVQICDASTGDPVAPAVELGSKIEAIAFSPDGARLAIGTKAGRVVIADARTGKATLPVMQHADAVNSVAFDRAGTLVVTASADRTARIWDAATGVARGAPLVHSAAVQAAVFDPAGTRVVTASLDRTARVWDVTTSAGIGAWLIHGDGVNTAVFNVDGSRIVTASRDGLARVWNSITGVPIVVTAIKDASLTAAVFDPDGTRFVTAGYSGARVWDTVTGAPLTPLLQHDEMVVSAEFSFDGTRLATTSFAGTACVWDASTGQRLTPFLSASVVAAAFRRDANRLATVSLSAPARVWDVSTDDRSLAAWRGIVDPLRWSGPIARDHATKPTELTRAGNLFAAGMARLPDQPEIARVLVAQAEAIYRALGSRDDATRAAAVLAVIAGLAGDLVRARSLLGDLATAGDAAQLADLASFAQDRMRAPDLASSLAERALAIAPHDPATLANRVELLLVTRRFAEVPAATDAALRVNANAGIRCALRAFAWAAAKLAQVRDASPGHALLAAYRSLPIGTNLGWSFQGARHELLYSPQPRADLAQVLAIFDVLAKPVDRAGAVQLAAVVEAPDPQRGEPAR